jgi:hypothetical protein
LPTSQPRRSDVKLLVGATVAVLMAGFLIAGGILVATRGGKSTACPQLNVGPASAIRRTLVNGGPTFQTGGAGCGFWLALADNEIVAYKVGQPSGCTLQLKRDHWDCGGTTIEPEDLEQYPIEIRVIEGTDAVIVNLQPTLPPSTASQPTQSTRPSTVP